MLLKEYRICMPLTVEEVGLSGQVGVLFSPPPPPSTSVQLCVLLKFAPNCFVNSCTLQQGFPNWGPRPPEKELQWGPQQN